MNVRRRALWPALFVLPLLASCASAPPRQPLPDAPQLPANFAEVPPGDYEGERWWEDLGDPWIDSLVTAGIERNASVRALTARVEASRQAAGISAAARWPSLDASLGAQRQQQVLVGIPVPGGGTPKVLSTSFSAQVAAGWELDLWNRLGQEAQAATANWQADAAGLEAARLSLAAQVVRLAAALRVAENQLDLAEETQTAFASTARLVDDRFRRGLTSALDARLARSQEASARVLVAQRLDERQRARRALEALLGVYPAAELEAPRAFPPALPPVAPGLPAALISRRPDLRAAERRLAARFAEGKASRRALLPSISLSASAGRVSTELGDLLEGDFSTWSLAGSLLQPLFAGGRRIRAIKAANSLEEAAALDYLQAVLDALREVEDALQSNVLLEEQLTALDIVVTEAREAERLAQDRYGRGLGDLIAWLEAQRRALDAESSRITLLGARIARRADLHVALGGGSTLTFED